MHNVGVARHDTWDVISAQSVRIRQNCTIAISDYKIFPGTESSIHFGIIRQGQHFELNFDQAFIVNFYRGFLSVVDWSCSCFKAGRCKGSWESERSDCLESRLRPKAQIFPNLPRSPIFALKPQICRMCPDFPIFAQKIHSCPERVYICP